MKRRRHRVRQRDGVQRGVAARARCRRLQHHLAVLVPPREPQHVLRRGDLLLRDRIQGDRTPSAAAPPVVSAQRRWEKSSGRPMAAQAATKPRRSTRVDMLSPGLGWCPLQPLGLPGTSDRRKIAPETRSAKDVNDADPPPARRGPRRRTGSVCRRPAGPTRHRSPAPDRPRSGTSSSDYRFTPALHAGQRLDLSNIDGNITVTQARGASAEIVVHKIVRRGNGDLVKAVMEETSAGVRVCTVYLNRQWRRGWLRRPSRPEQRAGPNRWTST